MTALTASGRRRAAASLLVAAAIPLAACSDGSAGPEAGPATVQDVNTDSIGVDPFLGNTVTVSGEVTSIISPKAFRISGDDWGGEPLRVINAGNAVVTEGSVVQVTGTVREFEETAIEQEYKLTLDDNLFDDWSDDHVVVASKVMPI